MSLRDTIKLIERFSNDNSPMLLTAVGVAGTVTTAVLSGRAALRYRDAHGMAVVERQRVFPESYDIEPRDKLELLARHFTVPVVAGSLTIASVICANRIGTKRAAALAAAYTVSEKLHEQYREKVVEHIGLDEERKVRTRVAQQRTDDRTGSDNILIINEDARIPIHDHYTGRDFLSSVEAIEHAKNVINSKVINDGYASLSDFYEQVGLPATSMSEEVGWTPDKILEVHLTPTKTADGLKPMFQLDFTVAPHRGYYKINPGSQYGLQIN